MHFSVNVTHWFYSLAYVLADGIVALHQLVDAQAPPVAVAVALGAALALP